MTRLFYSSCLLLAVAAGPAFAVVLEDFESGYGGLGTLIADPADAGNTVLHLVSHRGEVGVPTDVFAIDTNGFVGKVTMDIYDFGATLWDGQFNPPFPANGGSDDGPRWGVQGDSDLDGTLDNWVAAGIANRPWLDMNQGYAYLHDDDSNDANRAFSFSGSWFSPNFFGNPRRVKTNPLGALPDPPNPDDPSLTGGLQFIGNGTIESPQVAGAGAWTTWEFDIAASGNVTIRALEGETGKFADAPYATDEKTQYNSFAPNLDVDMTVVNMKQIWVGAGVGDNDTAGILGSRLGVHGVLVDNITFDGVTTGPLPGDANNDGTVDLLDLDILGTNFGTSPATFAQGDFNGDNVVDLLDLDILGTNFGNSAAAAVPEPTTLISLCAGGLLCFATRRRETRATC